MMVGVGGVSDPLEHAHRNMQIFLEHAARTAILETEHAAKLWQESLKTPYKTPKGMRISPKFSRLRRAAFSYFIITY